MPRQTPTNLRSPPISVSPTESSLVAAGGEYFPPTPAEPTPVEEVAEGRRGLSPRQVQVLEQIMLGKANREIAARLGISAATVKLHVHAILKAIGARNRTEAALLGRDSLRLLRDA